MLILQKSQDDRFIAHLTRDEMRMLKNALQCYAVKWDINAALEASQQICALLDSNSINVEVISEKEKSKFYTTAFGDKFWYLPSKGKFHRHRIDCQFCSCGQEGTASLDARRIISPSGKGDSSKADGRCVCVHHIHSNGPAVEWAGGTKEWLVNNKRHRIDGPAVEHADGRKIWFIEDKNLPIKEVEAWIKENNIDLKTEAGQMAFKLRWS